MTLEYGKYRGSVEFNTENNRFYGKVLDIKNSNLTYEGNDLESLIDEFQATIDDYVDLMESLND